MTINELLVELKNKGYKKDVAIYKSDFLNYPIALHTAEHLASVVDNKDWSGCEVVEARERRNDFLIKIKWD